MTRWAVVLAGGVGSRFWPLSTPDRPKQLLPLVDSDPLLINTLRRLEPIVPPERTLILTNASLTDAVAAVAPSIPRRGRYHARTLPIRDELTQSISKSSTPRMTSCTNTLI